MMRGSSAGFKTLEALELPDLQMVPGSETLWRRSPDYSIPSAKIESVDRAVPISEVFPPASVAVMPITPPALWLGTRIGKVKLSLPLAGT
jgi:hypothetical protein